MTDLLIKDNYSDKEQLNTFVCESLVKEKISTCVEKIDPVRCTPWRYHNRNVAWLTKERCHDLIFSIQQNGQLEPILVRKLDENSDFDYEIICGVRRWFACSQIINQKVLALVTSTDDKTCATLMHAENASSKDITEFERAFSFAQQLKSGVFKNQSEMASMIGLSQGHISKLIKASEIFNLEWIRDLFQNKLDIPIKYAYELSALLKNSNGYLDIQKEAELISLEKSQFGEVSSALQILKRLIGSCKPKSLIIKNSPLMNLGQKSVISFKRNKGGKLFLSINPEVKSLNPGEVEQVCMKIIRDYISDKIFTSE